MKRQFHERTGLQKTVITVVLLLLFSATLLSAQLEVATSSDILADLKKLNVLGSALYIAAHPDDENTAFLAYLTKGRLVNAAYLSLTRGDGGQNLLGPEQGPLLGILRTQELLSARRIDGAGQFFTRAIDFGYSKSAEETLHKWDREKILSDIVLVIRRFRPDVIITRFSETHGGHGHHLVSAILAKEAFYAAADPARFPEQLKTEQPWQTKRILWNTWSPGPGAIFVDVGDFNPLLGESYQEFAAASRSMHKSQGFGASPGRGSQPVYFDLLAGDSARTDLFDKVDLTWNRVSPARQARDKIDTIIRSFDQGNPHKSVPALIDLYRYLLAQPNQFWIERKRQEIKKLIRECTALWLESIVWEEGAPPGSRIDVRTEVINRSDIPITVDKIHTTFLSADSLINKPLVFNKPFSFKQTFTIPDRAPYTQPFWLEKKNDGYMYNFAADVDIVRPESPPAMETTFYLTIAGQPLSFNIPVRFRRTDAVKGEQLRPFVIRPAISVAVEEPTYLFPSESTRTLKVILQSTVKDQNGNLSLKTPAGWHVKPAHIPFHLSAAGDQQVLTFELYPDFNAQSGAATAIAQTSQRTYDKQIIEINYDHIPVQTVLMPAKSHLVNLDIAIIPGKIGYIMGSGDEIPRVLTQLGYDVDLLSDEELDTVDLSVYQAIICGVRAFNTRKELARQQKRLIQYVEDGGTWIVQHNTRFGFQVKQIGPYPFSVGRDRISEEDAPLKILIPEHPVFNYPNTITQKDFENWVQERGLYFADSWEGKLYPLLAGHDDDEPDRLGGLLYARYGNGVFIFTALSWFRELPAGVPGAARFFVNLISARGGP